MTSPEQQAFYDACDENGFSVRILATDECTLAQRVVLTEANPLIDRWSDCFPPHVATATVCQNGAVLYHSGAIGIGSWT